MIRHRSMCVFAFSLHQGKRLPVLLKILANWEKTILMILASCGATEIKLNGSVTDKKMKKIGRRLHIRLQR